MEQKRYWLRGGVCGIFLALAFSTYLYYEIPCTDTVNCKSLNDFIGLDVFLLIYLPGIILGMIIGWIYGKMKTRKQIGTIMK